MGERSSVRAARRSVSWQVTCLLLLTALPVAPHDAPECALVEVDRFQYWRRLSLDLRQRAPDAAELEALVAEREVPERMLDGLLASDELRALSRAYHRDLLWASLRPKLVFAALNKLDTVSGDRNNRLYAPHVARSEVYRGKSGVPCADRRQLEFEADGTPVPGPDGLDGWVEVQPYWAPGTTVRVCAYDAQTKLVAQEPDGSETDCALPSSWASRRCGCGPHLDFCSIDAVRPLVNAAFEEQLLRLVDRVVLEDRPYTELLTTSEMDVNGPLAHFLRWQAEMAHDVLLPREGDAQDLPPLAFTDSGRWVTVTRRGPQAGVLTLPVYLLRFQTNRGRAHRFHNAFLCQPFLPPPGGLRIEQDSEPNVAKKSGCSYCHQTLEPAAAHWGRFSEQGSVWLDPQLYPVDSEACRKRKWKGDERLETRCEHDYLLDHEPRGRLRAFEFALDGTPEGETIARNAEAGPRKLVEEALQDGRFARCTVQHWWTFLLHREMDPDELATVLPRLSEDFAASGYRLKGLLKAIVTQPAYRSGH